ncbi:putative F-box/LRR-repeat protein At5g54820 [Triticum dicoccoides]|uniref:putative F-box/LRR-repeat protein At5g54820 n=1 Tax=Triticum dicoccoides TaxID=85692 RepID=UPI001890B94E|nr:putative F-box/LRR-repeat protein At5g54820 [Triticum dicoccoides]
MARTGEEEVVPPPPPLDLRQPMEEAATGKLRRSDHYHRVTDTPSLPPPFRMEDLPIEIQPVIMSLLPLKEAMRASIVSKGWRMLWRFHSNLCFDSRNDMDSDTDDEFTHRDSTKIKQAKFIETVNCVIQHHSGLGINKFSIRCGLHKEDSEHLNRWVSFAASSKAKIIDFNLKIIDCPFDIVHHFPLEVLDAQGSSFVQSLFLVEVAINPHSGIRGFIVLRRLVLKYVEIFGDFPGFLANLLALEDLEMIKCSGVTTLSIPRQVDKLKHLLVDIMDVEMVEFHAGDLTHFEYQGPVIPIVHHGCSKLEKATIMFEGSKGLSHVFNDVPIILGVNTLSVQAHVLAYEQLEKVAPRPHGMFMHSRHMTCGLTIISSVPKADNGVLQLACCLNLTPQLETLHLDMTYSHCNVSVPDDFVEEEGPHMHRHDHLRSVGISGFRCYTAQTALAYCLLENACVLEHMRLQPWIVTWICPNPGMENIGVEGRFLPGVREWARLTSEHFGKAITVLDAPSE